jgi:hypothetical protein
MARTHFLRWVLVLLTASGGMACSHALRVKNLDLYSAPLQLGRVADVPPDVAVQPFAGAPDDLFYFNALVERLNMSPGIGEVQTGFVGISRGRRGFEPDLILSIRPRCEYRSSGWNFPINFPGFLLFVPLWNGYVYRADIVTEVLIQDADGNPLQQLNLPISYNIRQGDADRVTMAELSWFEVGVLALIGGIYNATTFDRDIIPELQVRVKDNFANYVMDQLQPKLIAAADAVMVPELEPELERPEEALPPL